MIAVVQLRDVLEGGLSLDTIAYVQGWEVRALGKHRLEEGDLLIANKGSRITTYLYDGEPINCVASSSFFVIRVDRQKLNPVFLRWYLHQSPAKEYLTYHSTLSNIPSLAKPKLDQLKIPVPPLSVQLKVSEVLFALEQERQLLKKMIEEKEKFGDSFVWELLSRTDSYQHEK